MVPLMSIPAGDPGGRGDPAAVSEHARRAGSFGAAAQSYATHRPDYPAAAIGWALEPAVRLAASRGRPARILDLGAGTGKLTAQIAALTLAGNPPEVTAVEPDPHMLAELRGRLPGVRAAAGRAEQIPLPAGAVDAVLAGQAAHWFDLDRALPEIARVLGPGGVFAGLWNADDDRVDWVAGLHRISGRANVVSCSSFEEAEEDDEIIRWLAGPRQRPVQRAGKRGLPARPAQDGRIADPDHAHALDVPDHGTGRPRADPGRGRGLPGGDAADRGRRVHAAAVDARDPRGQALTSTARP